MSTEPPVSAAPRRLAVFSDVHGNMHALQAVLEAIDTLGIGQIICCGDVVGYGAFPNECIDLLRRREIPTLAGNHDHAALGITDIQFFNDIARRAVEWTRERLTAESAEWLRQRPYILERGDDFFFVHASPVEPEQWGYVLTFGDAREAFEEYPHRFLFIGHSHQPAVVERVEGQMTCPEGIEVALQDYSRYLVNVGSVGQPRDRVPLACFVTVDLDARLLTFHRVPYDIAAAQDAILAAGLPEELAERLAYGW